MVPGPLGSGNHCACAAAPPKAMASATPAPIRYRFLIPLPPAANTRATMVTPPPLRHVYHRLLRWQWLFGSPTPSIGQYAQNIAESGIPATVCPQTSGFTPIGPRHLRNTHRILHEITANIASSAERMPAA